MLENKSTKRYVKVTKDELKSHHFDLLALQSLLAKVVLKCICSIELNVLTLGLKKTSGYTSI